MVIPLRNDARVNEKTHLLESSNVEADRQPVSSNRWTLRNRRSFWVSIGLTTLLWTQVLFWAGEDEEREAHHKKTTTCLTPACVHASSEILYNLSPKYKELDPCTDFEELVCSGWDDRHDLRPDQGDAFTGTIMSESSQTLLRHILEASYPNDSEHSNFSPARIAVSESSVDEENFNKLKDAYEACMDEDTIKNAGTAPLLDVLHQIEALYPLDSANATETRDRNGNVLTYLAQNGVSALVSAGAGADDKDPDVVVIQVSPPWRIGLPAKDYYKDADILQKYEKTIGDVFELLGAGSQKSGHSFQGPVLGSGKGIVELEKKFAAASPDAEDQSDVTKYYNPMSLVEADKLAPQINVPKLLRSLAPSSFQIDRLIVMSPDYMRAVESILNESGKDEILSYFLWKAIQSFAGVIEADALKPYTRFVNELQGKDPESSPERWRTCVAHVDNGLGWILSRFFVEKAFSAKAKVFGDQIVSDIKKAFIKKLEITTWMDKSVIKLAIDKVHKIVQKIGYPTKSPDITDPAVLHDYYTSVNITASTFFANAISIRKFDVAREWSALGKPVDREEWGMSVPTVNAYYNPPGNEIVFPAGIMQFPVFDVNVPKYLSYGAFGSVSGHELSHAFDSTGRHYDQNGNFTDWWTPSTVAGFEERADCFVNQYHNFTIPGPDKKPLHVNGKLTLGENIADAGGVAAAFAAWKVRRHEKPDQDLPGLEHFSQEQLFFVSYANWWCGKSRAETAISRIYTDPHAPKWARIIGTMANSKDFLKSFDCPAKKPVCELW